MKSKISLFLLLVLNSCGILPHKKKQIKKEVIYVTDTIYQEKLVVKDTTKYIEKLEYIKDTIYIRSLLNDTLQTAYNRLVLKFDSISKTLKAQIITHVPVVKIIENRTNTSLAERVRNVKHEKKEQIKINTKKRNNGNIVSQIIITIILSIIFFIIGAVLGRLFSYIFKL